MFYKFGFLFLVVFISCFSVFQVGCGGDSLEDRMRRAQTCARDTPDPDKKERPGSRKVAKKSNKHETKAKTEKKAASKVRVDSHGNDITSKPLLGGFDKPKVPRKTVSTAKEAQLESITKLTKISQALKRYSENVGRFPSSSTSKSNGGQVGLSWRVQLLPYLGYQSLYNKFDLKAPWNSTDNYELLKEIPDEYRHPILNDFNTSYVMPVGKSTTFPRVGVRVNPEDPIGEIIHIIEVDSTKRVPWSKPEDWQINRKMQLSQQLKLPFSNGFPVIMGDYRVMIFNGQSANESQWYSALCPDDGKRFDFDSLFSFVNDNESVDAEGAARLEKILGESTASGDRTSGSRTTTDAGSLTTSSVYPDGLAAKFLTKSKSLLGVGESRIAAQNYFAAIALSQNNDFVKSQFGWVKGLKRPVSEMRFGIGVKAGRIDPKPIKEKIELVTDVPPNGKKELEKYCGELAPRMISVLDAYMKEKHFGVRLADSVEIKKRSRVNAKAIVEPIMNRVGIDIYGRWDIGKLTKIGQRQLGDVLIVFDIETKPLKRAVNSTTKIRIIDLNTRENLFQTRPLNHISVARARQDPSLHDPVIETFESIKEFIDENLTYQEMPALQPEHAKRRIERIIKNRDKNPLKGMAEIRLYLAMGLISQFELNEYFDRIVQNEKYKFVDASMEQCLKMISEFVETSEIELAVQNKNKRSRDRDDD